MQLKKLAQDIKNDFIGVDAHVQGLVLIVEPKEGFHYLVYCTDVGPKICSTEKKILPEQVTKAQNELTLLFNVSKYIKK